MMKKTTTLALAAAAVLGALSMSAAPAFAGPGFRGGYGHHGRHFDRHGRHWGHRRHGWHGRHRYGWGYGVYGAPLYVGAAAYAAECYLVRRPSGRLIKVCE
jgi:hypothetical protein